MTSMHTHYHCRKSGLIDNYVSIEVDFLDRFSQFSWIDDTHFILYFTL